LPLVIAENELKACGLDVLNDHAPRLICENFLQALSVLEKQRLASVLPDFLNPGERLKSFLEVRDPAIDSGVFAFRLAWNPRLLRLNVHAIRQRDFLDAALARQVAGKST
jgi:hypothetical protein